MARVILHAKGLPKYFWVEAVQTACHIINHIYLTKNTKKTSYEVWYNKNPTWNTLEPLELFAMSAKTEKTFLNLIPEVVR